jgi:hypothetical protein
VQRLRGSGRHHHHHHHRACHEREVSRGRRTAARRAAIPMSRRRSGGVVDRKKHAWKGVSGGRKRAGQQKARDYRSVRADGSRRGRHRTDSTSRGHKGGYRCQRTFRQQACHGLAFRPLSIVPPPQAPQHGEPGKGPSGESRQAAIPRHLPMLLLHAAVPYLLRSAWTAWYPPPESAARAP